MSRSEQGIMEPGRSVGCVQTPHSLRARGDNFRDRNNRFWVPWNFVEHRTEMSYHRVSLSLGRGNRRQELIRLPKDCLASARRAMPSPSENHEQVCQKAVGNVDVKRRHESS